MKTVAVCFFLIVSVLQGSALRCYSCNDCSMDGLDNPFLPTARCDDELTFDFTGLSEPQCVKDVKRDGTVNRYCSTKAACGALFLDKCDSPSEVSCTTCCGTNTCNGALNPRPVWQPTVLSFVMAAILTTGFQGLQLQ